MTTFPAVVRGILKAHGRRTAAFAVLPGLLVLILGLLYGGGLRGVGIAVVNHDQGFDMPFLGPVCMKDRVMAKLDAKAYKPVEVAGMEEAERGVREGTYAAIVEFPENFTRDLLISREDPSYKMESKVRLLTDPSNSPAAAAVLQGLMNAFLEAASESGGASIPLERSSVAGMNGTFYDFLVTGILTLLTFLLAAMMPLRALAGDRAAGGPFASSREQGAIAAGGFAVFAPAAFIQAGLIVAAAAVTFPLTLSGNAGIVCLMFAMFLCVAVLVGICGSRLKAGPSAFIPLLVSPLFFTGMTIPLETLPHWIRPIAYAYPHFYMVHGVRGQLLRGLGPQETVRDFTVLACFIVVFAIAAMLPKRGTK